MANQTGNIALDGRESAYAFKCSYFPIAQNLNDELTQIK